MARILEGRTGQAVYSDVLNVVRRSGRRRQSRNGPTLELADVTIVLDTPEDALPLHTGRQLSRKVAAVEALQLIGAFSNPEWAVKHAPGLKPYRDDDGSFYGAYGNRIGHQLDDVARKLAVEMLTRQAVITLWNPDLDNEPGHRDYPCTIAIGFSVNGHALDVLNMRVQMRSNDAWLGLPYDMFQFGQLQLTLCNVLDLRPGTYTHTAWSMHIYEENIPESYNVDSLGEQIPQAFRDVQPKGIGQLGQSIMQVRGLAESIAYDSEPYRQLTDDEKWYADVLHG